MSASTVWLKLEQVAYAPGEEIRGSLHWNLAAAPTGGRLRLCWYTRGKGKLDEGVAVERDVTQLRSVHGRGAETSEPYRGLVSSSEPQPLAAEDTRSFRFDAPQAPYSFSGSLVSLGWELRAEVDGEETRQAIVLSPTRETYKLDERTNPDILYLRPPQVTPPPPHGPGAVNREAE